MRKMKKAADIIVAEYDGQLPNTSALLETLPGIGSYTAGAIASIAYHAPAPAVDGNVLRVAMRGLAREDDIMKASVRKNMERAIHDIIPKENPGGFNTGIMELGETVVIPNGMPLSNQRPIKVHCTACANGNIDAFPV